MKKSAKNCTLYHVVNKSVWADIGATCACSANRRRHTDILQLGTNILGLTGLQHQYIGVVQGESKYLQHHAYSVKRCLFNQLE